MLLHMGRVALLIAREARKAPVRLDEEVRWAGRAWPWLCDSNLHVNNAEYGRLLEYGRWIWIVRTGIWRRLREQRSNVIVAGSSQVFRRELRVLSAFEVRTRLSGVDERSAIFDQSVWTPDGKLACHSYQRMMVVGGGQIRSPHALVSDAIPPIDDSAVQSWIESQMSVLAREKAGTLAGAPVA